MQQRNFESLHYLAHVVLALQTMNSVVSSHIEEIIHIHAPRIVPEHSDLKLECEVKVLDAQDITVEWYFSETMTPVQSISNIKVAQTNGKSSLQISSVLRQQSNIYYCCLESSNITPTTCVSHSLLVLYTTLGQQINRIDDRAGVLVLTRSTDNTPQENDNLSFAIRLRYRWEYEHVQLLAFPDTYLQGSHPNETWQDKSEEKPFWKHINYNVEYTSLTSNRLFAIKCFDKMGPVMYHLHVFLNGKPKPRMNDIIVLPDAESIELSCFGSAYPAPRLTFYFTPCSSLEWNNCNNAPIPLGEIISTSNTTTFNESLPVIYGTHFTTGIVHCKATNTEGTSSTHSKLLKRNQHEMMMLQVLHPVGTIYQDDSVTVQCSVDRYNFTNSFTFRATDQQHTIEQDVPGEEGYFSWVANFTIANVTITEDFGVECEAMQHNGTLTRKRLSLKIVRPYLSVRERLIRVLARADVPLLLSCNVAARPKPQYRWYRNGELLPSTNFMIVVSSSGGDEFSCYTWNRAGEDWIRWIILQPRGSDDHVLYQITLIAVLFAVVIIGCVMCYVKIKQLYRLFILYKAVRNRLS